MKTFPAPFAAEKNRKTGAAPVWILKLTAGGLDYYLADNSFVVAPWGITTKNWIRSWGKLTEGVSGLIGDFKISDFSATCLADPDASPNIISLATQYNLEKYPVTLYQWYFGCADPPQEFMRGYIRDYPITEGDTVCTLQVQDETLKWERVYVGRKVTLADYPEADPDDVGEVIPIIYGTVSKLPALAVNAGVQTSLPAGLSAAATSFTLSSGQGLAAGVSIQVDDEEIRINGLSGDSITACTRGYNGTLAATHQRGAMVWERKVDFEYLVADHPVTSIPKVYGQVGQALMDVTALCGRYTGQAGNAHAAYPGKAVVVTPGYITMAQAVSLLVNDGISITDAMTILNSLGLTDSISLSDAIALSDTIGVSQGSHSHAGAVNGTTTVRMDGYVGISGNISNPASAYDSNTATYCNTDLYGAVINYHRDAVASVTGPLRVRLCAQLKGGDYSYDTMKIYLQGVLKETVSIGGYGTTLTTVYSGWQTLTNLNNIYDAAGTYAQFYLSAWALLVVEVWWEVEYGTTGTTYTSATGVVKTGAATKSGTVTKTGTVAQTGSVSRSGAVSKTGTVTLSGNSVANTLVGDAILVDVVSNLTAHGDVISDLLATWCGVNSFQQVGAFPTGYAFNGAITEYRRALDWVNDLAWQCRAWFRHSLGSAILTVRGLNPAPVKTLSWCRVANGKMVWSRAKTPYGEIINKIDLLYDRDWSQAKGDKAYRGVAKNLNQSSIDDYGLSERPELFQFDFVTSQAMAADLLAFYLGYYAPRHWLHTFATYYYDSELEFADPVALGFAGGLTGEIAEAGFDPGSDVIEIKLIE